MVDAIKTGLEPTAETVSVCNDSDYNQSAMPSKRRIIKAAAFSARRIDDECSSYSIIYLFEKK